MDDMSGRRRVQSASLVFLFGLAIVLTLSLTTCKAFSAGLGAKIDIEPPSVSILSPTSGDYVKGTITIKGKAADDTGVKSVVLGLTNDQTQAPIGQAIQASFDSQTGLWTAPLDVPALVPSAATAEVPVSIVVTVTDIADPPKTTRTIPPLKLVFDEHAPTLALSYPDPSALMAASDSSDHLSLSGIVPFSGTAFDVGLKQVSLTYTPYDDKGNRGSSTTILASGTSAWSLNLDTTKIFATAGGRVDLAFTATDSAYSDSDRGGNSTTFEMNPKDSATNLYGVVIDQDAGKPTFNSDNGNNLNLDLKAGLWPNGTMIYTLNPGVTIPLVVEDVNGLATTDGSPYTWTTASNLDVDVSITPKLPDGTMGTPESARAKGWLLPVSTIAPKTRVAPDGKTYVISAAYRLSFPSDQDGDFVLGFSATNDHRAKAPAGNTVANETRLVGATVTIDLAPPRATETNYGSSLIQSNRDVSFAGIADDAKLTAGRKAKSAVLTYSKDGASPIAASPASTATPNGFAWDQTKGTWSYTLPGSLGDGTYVLTLTVTDFADKVSTVSRTVQIDTTAPASVIVTPPVLSLLDSAFWLSGPTAGIGGTSSDAGSGIAGIYYAVVPKGSATPAFSSSNGVWVAAGGTLNWSGTLKLSGAGGLGEGQFTLCVAGLDAVGNVETAKTRDFGVDQNPPTVTESHSATSASTSTFTLGGSVADTNAIASLAVTEQVGSAAAVNATVTRSVVAASGDVAGRHETWQTQQLPTVGANDGVYTYTVTATDVAGKTAQLQRIVMIDKTPPTGTVLAPPAATTWTGVGEYTIGGTASDGSSASASGLASVTYQLDGGAWANADWTDTSGGKNLSGTWSATLKGLSEGLHTVVVKLVDAAGNSTTLSQRTFGVDFNPPNLGVGTPAIDPSVYAASGTNGFPGFAGTAWDSNALATSSSLAVSYTRNGGTPTGATINLTDSSHAAPGNVWSWTPFPAGVDAIGHTNDGIYVFSFTLTDIAGKTATVTRQVQIDTTPPALVVTAPVVNESAANSSYTIQGTSTDTGGVGLAAANAVEYSLDGGVSWIGTASGSGHDVSVSGTSWSAAVSLGTTEGAKTLKVRSTDKLGNQASQTIGFFYDLNPPVMQETGVGGGTNPASYAMSTNGAIHFAGTASDTDALAGAHSLTVSVDGGAAQDVLAMTSAPYTAGGTAGSWTLAVAVGGGGLADGVHGFVFTARDIAGKTTSVTRTVTIDTTAPVSGIATPTAALTGANAAYWLSGTTAAINGTSADAGSGATGVTGVYYTIVTKGSAAPAFSKTGWTQAGGTTNWNGTVTLSGMGGIGEGEFTLYVAATDAVGNVETAKTRDFGVDQAPPVLAEIHAATNFTKASFALSGTVADGNAIASLGITESKNGGTAQVVGFTPTVVLSGAKSAGYTSVALPLGGVVDGTYTYLLTAMDAAGKTSTVSRTYTIDTTAPTVSMNALPAWISSSAYTIGGSATDPNAGASGVASVQFSLDGGSTWNAAAWTDTSGTNVAGTWTATMTGMAEGPHGVMVRATDAAGNVVTNAAVNFGVDYSPPNLAVTAPPTTVTAATASSFVGIAGTVWDSYLLATSGSLSVSYSKNGGAATTAPIKVTDSVHATPGNAWGWTPFAGGIDAATHTNDGIYSFTFTATDAAGKMTQSGPFPMTVDTMSPQLTITSPATTTPMTWVASSSLGVTGVANDGSGSGVKSVYVLVDGLYLASSPTDHSTDDPTATGSLWTKATGTVSFGASLSLTMEGTKTLWVKAVDNDGNWTTAAEALSAKTDFGFDKTAPSLSSTDSVPSTVNSVFTLAGNVSDAASGLASLTVSVDGASPPTALTFGSGSWTYPVSSLPADGTHSYLFTARDLAGNVKSITRTVAVDTQPPVVTFGNIDPTKNTASTALSLVDSSPKIIGTITDSTGVGAVQSVVEFSADNGSTWTTAQASTALSTAGSTPLSVTFSKDLSVSPFTTDGLYRITLSASDTLATPNIGSSATVWFRLDRNNPVVSSLLSTAPATSVNSSFSLSGSASSNNLSVVQYKLDSGSYTAMSGVVPGTFSFSTAGLNAISVAAATMTEGAHTLTVEALSTGQRVGTQTFSFLVDRTPPTPTITMPAGGGAISGSMVAIGGGATDLGGGGTPAGVASVDWQIARGISLSLSTSNFTAATAHGLSAGDLVYFSPYSGGSLPSGISANVPYWVSATGLTATSFEISATNGGAVLTPGAGATAFFAAKAGAWTAATYGASTWNTTLNSTTLSEGSYLLLARATDLAGNVSAAIASRVTIDQGLPTLDFSTTAASGIFSASFAASGLATDPPDASVATATNGIASVLLAIDDPAFSASHAGTVAIDLTKTTAWSFDLGAAPASFFNGLSGAPSTFAAIPEGAHTLYARAIDKAGKTFDTSFAFIKDTVAPSAAFANLAIAAPWTVYLQTATKVSGTVSDATGVASASYAIDQYTGGAWVSKQAVTSLGTTANSTNFPWTVDLTGYADGHYRLTLTAQDRASPVPNVMAARVCEFYIDTAAPSATITIPVAGEIASTDIGAPTGAASDANLTAATIQLDTNTPVDVFASAGAWTYPSWNWAGLSEGTHTLTLTATDIAGRVTTAPRTFVKDTMAPGISYGNIATSGPGYPTVVSTSATPSLSGTLSDASGIASYSWTLSVYNPASQVWNTMTSSGPTVVAGNPLNYNWSIPLSTLALPDGKYRVAISATDVAVGPNTTASPAQVQFFISNASPSGSLASPALGSWVSASFTLTGTAQDSANVTGVSVLATSGSSPSFGASNALPAFSVIGVNPATGTFQTSLPHGFAVGDLVYVAGSVMPTLSGGGFLSSTSTYAVASLASSSATSGVDEFTLSGVTLTGAGSGLLVAKAGTNFGSGSIPPSPALSVAGGTGISSTSPLFSNGDVVYFTGTPPSATPAIGVGTPYYVQSVSGSSFVLSTAAGGGTILNFSAAAAATVYSPSLNLGWLLPGISLGGVGNGAFTVYAQVVSANGKTSVISRSYSLDNQAPVISMNSPSTTSISAANSPTLGTIAVGASGSPLQGLVSIAGTTVDSGSGVSQNIKYYIGKTGTYQAGASASNWVLTLGDISGYANTTNAYPCDLNGQTLLSLDYWLIPIHFQAVDNAGNQVQATDYFVYNSNANTPTISISSPANAQTFGGQQRIYGTATQPVGVYGAEVYVDPTNGSTPPTSIPTSVLTSSATFTLISALASPLPANAVVYIKSVAQIPTLPGGATAGKAYYVVGATSTTTSFQVAATAGGSAVSFTSGTGVTYAVDQWAPVTLMTSGTSVSWYYDINVGNVYPLPGRSSQTISVTGRAWSATSFGGPRGNFTGYLASPLTMTFNNTFPTVTIATITPQGGSALSYTQSMDARGTFTLSGTASTPVGLSNLSLVDTGPFSGTSSLYAVTTASGTVTAIPFSTSGTTGNGYTYSIAALGQLVSGAAVTYAAGQSYKLLIVAPGVNTTPGTNPWAALGLGSTITPVVGTVFTVSSAGSVPTGAQAIESDASGKFQYSIAITINSSTVYPSLTTGAYFSGTLGFNLQAADLTTPTAQVTTSPAGVSVDNFAPLAGTPTGLGTVTDSSSNVYGVLTGAAQTISSSATDISATSGTVSGIKDIYVYLLDGSGNAVPLAGGSSIPTSTYTYIDYQGRTQTWPSTTVGGFYVDIATMTSGAYVGSGITGVTEMMGLSGSSTTWGIQLDTTKLADGPYTLAYTVFDIAGNATHYTYRIFVQNNGPKFGSVTLGTSVGGTAVTQSCTAASLPNTGFIAEGNTLSFNVSSVYGNGTTTPNGALSYKLTCGGVNYWSQGTVTGLSSNGATVTFNPTTVSPAIADTSTSNGASFVLTVTDATVTIPQSYSVAINMNIQNADHGTPAIGVAPFGTQYLLPTTNPYTTGKAFQTGPVSTYGQNIGPSGGHIDYTSPYTSGAASISGQVVFLGSAWNDQAMTKITATIPGYNGSLEFSIATYSGGTWAPLSGTGWSVAIDTSHQVLGLSGQQVNWTFTWDSSTLSTVTGKNLAVTFKAYNANPIPAQNSATAQSLVDAVPYISKVTTALSSAYSSVPSVTNRSALGYYPVQRNETIIIDGYNFNGISTSVALNGTPLTVGAVAGKTTTEVTASIGTTATSGGLVVSAGSPTAVSSTNNSNVNTAYVLTGAGQPYYYNDEPNNVNNNLLTDDRNLTVWSITSVSTDASIRYPSMRIVNSATASNQYIGWTYDSSENYFYMTDSGTQTPQQFQSNPTRYYDTAFAYDEQGDTFGEGNSGDITAGGGRIVNWSSGCFFSNQPGSGASSYTGGYDGGTYTSRFASLSSDGTVANTNSNRFQNPDIVAALANPAAALGAGNLATSYLSYYDAVLNQVMLRTGTVNGRSTIPSGTALSDKGTSSTIPWDQPGAITIAGAATSGAYSAIALNPVDRSTLVAVWYDSTNRRLWYSYNTAPTSAAQSGQWASHALVIDSSFAGQNCDITVDAGGGVHIAYYRSSSGDLCYAYLPGYASTSPQLATVDSYLSVGQYLRIGTTLVGGNYVPSISYYAGTYSGTSFCVKLATRVNFATFQNGAVNDQYTGAWEVQTVPATNSPKTFTVSIGYKNFGTPNGLTPVLGYATNAGLEYAYQP
ncbi:MAG: Ig-like domain-containing protein [Treponema sp.]|nr:Ig-like domain-containing protein [Treponema sp.]